MASNEKPDKVFAVHPVEAAIMPSSNGKPVIRLNRCYQDHNGTWRKSQTFFLTDLPKVRLAADAAYRFLALKEFTPTGGPTSKAQRHAGDRSSATG